MGSEFSSISLQPAPLFQSRETSLSQSEVHRTPLDQTDRIYEAGQAQEVSFRPSMPVLEAPGASKTSPASLSYNSVISQILETLSLMHATGHEMHLTQARGFAVAQKSIEELQQKELVELKESAERAQTSDAWGVLQTVASYILSAINAVLGVFLITQGSTVVGGMMVAAGLIEVANLAFSSCGFWNWLADQIAGENEELAKQIVAILPSVIGLVAGAVGAVGTVQLWNMQNQFDWAEQLLLISQTALSLTQGVASMAKGVTAYKVSQSEMRQILIEKGLAESEHQSEGLSNGMREMMHILSECTSQVSKIIQTSMHSYQRAIQG
ncbi:MAG: hypothetical protein HYX48_05650 [Chlamydiales bacterium]|nr:hypothetical protein [Chlamydiales bacterium]